jgi:hypothetical protein
MRTTFLVWLVVLMPATFRPDFIGAASAAFAVWRVVPAEYLVARLVPILRNTPVEMPLEIGR